MLNIRNKNFSKITNFNNILYEIPQPTVSSNVIKDDNTKSINILSLNKFQYPRNYDTQDTNTTNTVMSSHNLNATRKDKLPHKNLTAVCMCQCASSVELKRSVWRIT